ncbi:MAG: hypothetical protein WBE34_09045 [Candidatus Nitrosopolaris sp.]
MTFGDETILNRALEGLSNAKKSFDSCTDDSSRNGNYALLDSATKDGLKIRLSIQKDKRQGAKCRNPSKRSLSRLFTRDSKKIR